MDRALLAELSSSADSIARAAKHVLVHSTDAPAVALSILEELYESQEAQRIPLLYLFDCISQRAAAAKMHAVVDAFGACLLELTMIFLPLNRPAILKQTRVIAKVAKLWKERGVFSARQLEAVDRAFEAHAAANVARAMTPPPTGARRKRHRGGSKMPLEEEREVRRRQAREEREREQQEVDMDAQAIEMRQLEKLFAGPR